MGIIEKLFGKKKEQEAKKSVESEFFFSIEESAHIGDRYEYRVKASSRKEAFDKLINYFFGEESMCHDVKSDHRSFSYPGHATFRVEGMPIWFGKRISGQVREDGKNYQHKLEEYCTENGIKLDLRK
jgi:hypothetical protein